MPGRRRNRYRQGGYKRRPFAERLRGYRRYTLSILMAVAVLTVMAASVYSIFIKPVNDSKKHVTIEIYHLDGSTKTVKLFSNSEYLREAIDEENEELITGTEQEFGLLIETVDGVMADTSSGLEWWRFTKNGMDISTSIDTTVIEDGDKYEFTHIKTIE